MLLYTKRHSIWSIRILYIAQIISLILWRTWKKGNFSVWLDSGSTWSSCKMIDNTDVGIRGPRKRLESLNLLLWDTTSNDWVCSSTWCDSIDEGGWNSRNCMIIFVALVMWSCTWSTITVWALHVSLSAPIDLNLARIEDSSFTTTIPYSCLSTAFSRTFLSIPLLLTSQSVTRQQILLLNNLLLG